MHGDLELAYRLPLPGWPRAVFATDYGLRGGRLVVDGHTALEARSRAELEAGVGGALPDGTAVRAALRPGQRELALSVGGTPAVREDRLRARPSRSALRHAAIALVGSVAGLIASWLYLRKAAAAGSPWALKMAWHMAAWHLVLALTLVPASIWGQRAGIRLVQGVSAVFFAIHAGIAIANTATPDDALDAWLAGLNAASGLAFLAAVAYGQVAHRDMDPLRALEDRLPRARAS